MRILLMLVYKIFSTSVGVSIKKLRVSTELSDPDKDGSGESNFSSYWGRNNLGYTRKNKTTN